MVLGLRRRRAEKEVSIAGRMNSAVSCTETSMRNSDVIQKAQRGFRAFAEPVLRRATGPSDVPLPGAVSGTGSKMKFDTSPDIDIEAVDDSDGKTRAQPLSNQARTRLSQSKPNAQRRKRRATTQGKGGGQNKSDG